MNPLRPFLLLSLVPLLATPAHSQAPPPPPPPTIKLDAPIPLTTVKKETAIVPAGGIQLNFSGASLADVLNYLSEAAGFVIVQEAPVSGTVNVVSRQPVTPDEAV